MIKRISHIILALLLFSTTVGFSVSKHYCGDRLIATAINSIAESCCKDKATSDCCSTKCSFYKIDSNFVYPIIETNTNLTISKNLFVVLNTKIKPLNRINTNHYKKIFFYPPPNLLDRLASLQTFRC